MKHTSILSLLLPLLSLFSCQKEAIVGGSFPEGNLPQITITAVGIADTKSRAASEDVGMPEERQYESLYFYCFDATGKLLIQHAESHGGTYPYSLMLPDNVSTAGEVTIYAFASAQGVSMPTGQVTQDKLKALLTPGMSQHNAGDAAGTLLYTDARKIPMSTITTHNFATSGNAQVKLKRSVSKVRIRVANKIDVAAGITLLTDKMQLQFLNLRHEQSFLPLVAGSYTDPAIERFEAQWLTANQHTETVGGITYPFFAYLNEQLFDVATPPADRGQISFNLPYSTVLGGEVSNNFYQLPINFPLDRNHIYQITINVNVVGSGGGVDIRVSSSIEIVDWKEQNADIIE